MVVHICSLVLNHALDECQVQMRVLSSELKKRCENQFSKSLTRKCAASPIVEKYHKNQSIGICVVQI